MGVLSGKEQERAGNIWYQVVFADCTSYQPEYEIEVITDDNDDPYTLIDEGRFGRVEDLRKIFSYPA